MVDKLEVDSRIIELSSLDKELFPESQITKQEVIDYYRRIGPLMVPYMEGRPLTMHRFPGGIDESGFYQKEAPDYFPDWIPRVQIEVEEEGTSQPQITVEETATLVYLANQNCITPHIWLSRIGHLNHPDKLIFDLDPPEDKFELVRTAALDLRQLLEAVELVPYVMTSGSKGLHVVVPLKPSSPFDEVRAFARTVGDLLARQKPEQYTTEIRKGQRRGRLFLDYLRNSYAQNSVAPYALRALQGAPVATPLDWSELADQNLHSQRYHVKNIFRRLGQKEDPWAEIMRNARSISPAIEKLARVEAEVKS